MRLLLTWLLFRALAFAGAVALLVVFLERL